MLQIYIQPNNSSIGGYLDLLPNSVLQLESLSDLFDEDLSTGEFSLPIELPWTSNNRKLLDFFERLSSNDATLNYWVCTVLNSGYPIMQHAKLTILEKKGMLNYKSGLFAASISGSKGLFGTAIKNKKLRDVNFGTNVFGNVITFGEASSRDFATSLAKGNYPQYDYLGFAPVAIENFFDSSKSYNGEFLIKDTVNYIVKTGNGLLDWEFGRPLSTNGTPAQPGNTEYIDYRTIPFLKLKHVFVKAFESLGYTVAGEMLSSNAWDDLYIFNTTAIEFYSIPASADYNKKILLHEHVPDILISDFLKSILSFFNIYPIFTASTVLLTYRSNIFTNRKVLDITQMVGANFSSVYAENTTNKGYTVDYEWDSNDNYRGDRVKDLTDKTLVGAVDTIPQLALLNIGRPYTTDDMVFVTAENMYYTVANATTTPVRWDAYSERLGEVKVDDGSESIKIGCGTLCSYVELDEPTGVYIRRDKLGCRQAGSYWTDKYVKVKKDFSLRLFYIKKQVINGNEVPTSMNGDKTANGTILNPCSLALEGDNALLQKFHTAWIKAKLAKQTIKIQLPSNAKINSQIQESNTLQLNNLYYLPQKIERTIPPSPMIDIELKPL